MEEALSNGISISEFPTTTEAACCASENGMLVMMGAPNVVRGGSHSGNASALDVAKEGHLGALSSDYVPASLLAAVFELAAREIMPLPAAVNLVSANPAESVGLDDRGRIDVGRRADMVRVHHMDDMPLVPQCLASGRAGVLMRGTSSMSWDRRDPARTVCCRPCGPGCAACR